MSEPTNDTRADWALAAVQAFQGVTKTDDEDAISDLIADLLHLAERQGQDPATILARAQSNYEAERDEELGMASRP